MTSEFLSKSETGFMFPTVHWAVTLGAAAQSRRATAIKMSLLGIGVTPWTNQSDRNTGDLNFILQGLTNFPGSSSSHLTSLTPPSDLLSENISDARGSEGPHSVKYFRLFSHTLLRFKNFNSFRT